MLFGKKKNSEVVSLDDILGKFHETVQELDTFVSDETANIERIESEIKSLNEELDTSNAVLSKATTIGDNFKALLGEK